MANVLPPQIEFQPRPVAHAPSPLAFGFGLHSSSVGWQPTPGHHNPIPFQQLASAVANSPSVRVQKRRHEPDDEAESSRSAQARDDAMERSPTPERLKRSAPKRARLVQPDGQSKDGTSKESKGRDENDIDVGVLLASLPPQSLLPILMALLNEHPSLKTAILPLIPRPTLDTAVQALGDSAKKLRDAYPYSAPSNPLLTFGFGHSNPTPSNSHGGMRDSYVLSRLRPHIAEFMSACTSYLPYFSYLPRETLSLSIMNTSAYEGRSDRVSTALQSLQKDQSHPSETFIFLSAITNHFFEQPALTQTALGTVLIPRLAQEWRGWVDRVDEIVNRQGGMFGSDMVKSWERGLDEMARHRDEFRAIRDVWVVKVGWLVGRMQQHPMDEV